MIEARVVRSIEVIIHEHICPLPDLPPHQTTPGAECQAPPGTRPQGEAGLLRSTRCYLNSALTRRLGKITYQRETRRGPVSRSNNFVCRAMRASIDLNRLGERRSGSIMTFCRRTAVLVPQRSLGSSRFLGSSAMLKFRQGQKAAIYPCGD